MFHPFEAVKNHLAFLPCQFPLLWWMLSLKINMQGVNRLLSKFDLSLQWLVRYLLASVCQKIGMWCKLCSKGNEIWMLFSMCILKNGAFPWGVYCSCAFMQMVNVCQKFSWMKTNIFFTTLLILSFWLIAKENIKPTTWNLSVIWSSFLQIMLLPAHRWPSVIAWGGLLDPTSALQLLEFLKPKPFMNTFDSTPVTIGMYEIVMSKQQLPDVGVS